MFSFDLLLISNEFKSTCFSVDSRWMPSQALRSSCVRGRVKAINLGSILPPHHGEAVGSLHIFPKACQCESIACCHILVFSRPCHSGKSSLYLRAPAVSHRFREFHSCWLREMLDSFFWFILAFWYAEYSLLIFLIYLNVNWFLLILFSVLKAKVNNESFHVSS